MDNLPKSWKIVRAIQHTKFYMFLYKFPFFNKHYRYNFKQLIRQRPVVIIPYQSLFINMWSLSELLKHLFLSKISMKQINSKKKWLNVFLLTLLTGCFLLLSGGNAFAQQLLTVNGTIVDQTGAPVPGANIIVVGTTNGTISDASGKFEIADVPSTASLEIRFIGFVTQIIAVDGRNSINVTMADEVTMLGEMVVVGYGVQRKSDVTGAMAVVNAENLTTRPVTNVFEAMQGKVAGVDITSSQRPGELGEIRVRGNRSLNADNSPLYVVDGVILSAGGIESINPRVIESVSILKDASSTAIYGSRGANGVILVTTKRGKQGSLQFNYSGAFSFEKIHDLSPAMNASEYITWRRWAYHNAYPDTYNPGNEPNQTQDQTIFNSSDQVAMANVMKGWVNGVWDPSKVTNTDWTDFVTQTGITQEHTISASGGTEKMKNFISFGYLNNEGTQIGQAYERYNVSFSSDIQATKWFTMGGSVNASWGNQSYGFSRTGQSTGSGPTEIYAAAKRIFNWALPYDENGEIIGMPGGQNGVYTIMDEWEKSLEKRQRLRAIGSFYGSIDFGEILGVLKGLSFKTNFGPDFNYYRRGVYIDSSSAVRGGGTSYAAWNYERKFNWVLDNILSYTKSIDIHKFDITLLQSASKYDFEYSSMSAQNIPKPSYLWNNMGSVDITSSDASASMGTGLTQSQMFSYGARLNYSLMDKYLLTLTGRYDGSSVLAEGNKWSFFPSAALGWRMEQEPFLQDITWIEQLKLRIGVGLTGNAAVSPYGTLGNISSFYVPFGGSDNVLAYATNEPYYVDMAKKGVLMANPLLGWEKTTQYNLGIDFSLLNGRISGALDLYQSYTNDLLAEMKIPTLTGYDRTMANVAKTANKGVDVSINAIPIKTTNFTWNTSLNAAWLNEEIVETTNGKAHMIDNGWFIGEFTSVYYGIDNDGLWKESDAAEMAKFNSSTGPDGTPKDAHNFTVGSVKPIDQDGDYVIDAQNDRVVLGNKTPKWTLGWSNSFNYKGLELNVELFGRMGYMVSTGGETQNGTPNQNKIDYWTPSNTNADWQKPIFTGTPGVGGDPYSTLLGFKKASFIKFRNISLGYFLPNSICQPLGISNLKLYTQLRNPGCLYSSVDFLDLDMNTSFYNRGVTFGVEIGF